MKNRKCIYPALLLLALTLGLPEEARAGRGRPITIARCQQLKGCWTEVRENGGLKDYCEHTINGKRVVSPLSTGGGATLPPRCE